MKVIRTLLGTIGFAIAMLIAKKAKAEEPKFFVAPVAAITHENLTGEGVFSTGLDLGYSINKFVSLHGTAMASEANDYKGSVIDESELYGRASFSTFVKDRFSLYGKGGAVRDWQDDNWGFGVGAGAQLKFTKRISAAADYTIRAWFNGREKDGQIRALINIGF